MTLQEALETLKAMEEAQAAYGQAFSVMYVDGDTVAPKMSYKGRAKALGYLSGELYSKTVNERNIEAIQTILDAGENGEFPLLIAGRDFILAFDFSTAPGESAFGSTAYLSLDGRTFENLGVLNLF